MLCQEICWVYLGFKERFRIHKSDINIGKVRCKVRVLASTVNRKMFCTKWWWDWQSFVGKIKIQAGAITYVKPRVK